MATATLEPITDVTCASCGSADCVIYPIDQENPGKAAGFIGTTICPDCSTPTTEALVRLASARDGATLGAPIFEPAPGPLAELAAIVPQLDDEDKRLLEEGWHATADGTNCTAHFGYDEEGRTTYQGQRPSFALALLFDRENFEAGRPTALPYWEATV